MQDQDEEINEISESDLFDISNVKFDTKRTKDMRKIYLIAEDTEIPFNLMKYYLALKSYIFKIEQEIGIMDDINEVH